jgi:hypothetical protein
MSSACRLHHRNAWPCHTSSMYIVQRRETLFGAAHPKASSKSISQPTISKDAFMQLGRVVKRRLVLVSRQLPTALEDRLDSTAACHPICLY